MQSIFYRFANHSDATKIKELLSENDLPNEDIDKHVSNFLLAEQPDRLVGIVGLEIERSEGLLRSLAISQAGRCQGIGSTLLKKNKSYARLKNVKEVYLLTTTAEKYFEKQGFKTITRDVVPEGIKGTKEFRNLCPSTAVCMVQQISR